MDTLLETYRQLPTWAASLIAMVPFIFVVRYVLSLRKSDPDYIIQVRCPSCRWEGKVSKFKPICKQCNSRISLQAARKR